MQASRSGTRIQTMVAIPGGGEWGNRGGVYGRDPETVLAELRATKAAVLSERPGVELPPFYLRVVSNGQVIMGPVQV